ncbi:LOW QUALITY PROTEIN: uncharacterized protein LOC108115420 [Drosophila eugracilis]|uniref:LOW QUALITY PROTEIN: uncharacterized protein LOC108115420 n=1 Tax=Drosophila eugracilis TaxID=29029 RepID=UPI001BDB43A8|nr:LOW QUALITY PROTEIN: uncharacterized protein LOC108115420 [Drosophila eugracilis]
MSLLPLWAIDLNVDENVDVDVDVDVDMDVNMKGAATTTLNGNVRSKWQTLNTTEIPLSKCTPSSGSGFREYILRVSRCSPCSSPFSLAGFSCTRCARARVASIFRLPAPKPESTIEFQTVYTVSQHPSIQPPKTTIRRPRKTQRPLQFLCAIFYMRTKGGMRCRLWLVKVKGWWMVLFSPSFLVGAG